MSDVAVRIAGVTKRYGAQAVVDDISLDVAARESIVLVGPSGCGKTTLLRMIAGLDVPDSGEIWLDGRLVARGGRSLVPPHQRRIGLVFQDLALWPHLTVRGSLSFVMESVGVAKSEWNERIERVLKLVRIEALADRSPHQLSGGEQQRSAVARALASEPTLLLLDEPFSSLDAELRHELRGELRDLQQRLGLPTVYVTHDTDDAHELADRVVTMRSGRITAVST
ncbi:MAG: ABC transporter ATP-binding protein [Vicinamibacterales bacterium]